MPAPRYNPGRGGHAPGHLRESFDEWVQDKQPTEVEVDYVKRSGRWLIGQLWNCSDIMPSDLCADLDMWPGSTYAQGVRSITPDK